MHPALTCFLTGNFEEIVDQFIEISEDGLDYVRQNMSRICNIPSPHSLIFYNIYASYMEQDELGNDLVREGPFVNVKNGKKLLLRGEITRYNNSGYKNTPYRGVTEENKKEKTMTIDITMNNKSKFDSAIEDSKYNSINIIDLVSNDSKLEKLEKYTDKVNPYRYNFNGTYISKLKVRRIYNILKNYNLDDESNSLLYAITYNSILSQDAFDKIKSIVRSRRK